MNTKSRILELLHKSPVPTITELCEALAMKRASVRKALQRMEKAGQIEGTGRTWGRIYTIPEKKYSVPNVPIMSRIHVPNPSDASRLTLGITQPKPSIRLHALAMLKPYTKPRSQEEIRDMLREAGIQAIERRIGNTSYHFCALGGFPARFTTKSLTIWALERKADRSARNASMLYAWAEGELEERFRGVGVGFGARKVLECHIALTEDDFAKHALEQGHKVLIRDREDSLARFLIDFSNKVPEAEFVHAQHAPQDTERYTMLVDRVVHREWGVDEQLAYNAQQQDVVARLEAVVVKQANMWEERVVADVALKKDIKKHLRLVTAAVRRIEEDHQRRLD